MLCGKAAGRCRVLPRSAHLWALPDTLFGMSPIPLGPGLARSAAEVNAEIRDLVAAGGAGTDRYRELLVEWGEAIRAEVEPAA